MRLLAIIILSLASFGWLETATADSWKGCEVERKWKKGEYEEKVKCKPGRYEY